MSHSTNHQPAITCPTLSDDSILTQLLLDTHNEKQMEGDCHEFFFLLRFEYKILFSLQHHERCAQHFTGQSCFPSVNGTDHFQFKFKQKKRAEISRKQEHFRLKHLDCSGLNLFDFFILKSKMKILNHSNKTELIYCLSSNRSLSVKRHFKYISKLKFDTSNLFFQGGGMRHNIERSTNA